MMRGKWQTRKTSTYPIMMAAYTCFPQKSNITLRTHWHWRDPCMQFTNRSTDLTETRTRLLSTLRRASLVAATDGRPPPPPPPLRTWWFDPEEPPLTPPARRFRERPNPPPPPEEDGGSFVGTWKDTHRVDEKIE